MVRLIWGITAATLLLGIAAAIWRPGAGGGGPAGRQLHAVRVMLGKCPQYRDLPLGSTEASASNVTEKLEYDDVLYREVGVGRTAVTVYIGYWRKGRRPPSFIEAHTPDRCWVLAGMTCEAARDDYQVRLDGGTLDGLRWRRFRDSERRIYNVWFFHRVGNRFYKGGASGEGPVGLLRRATTAVFEMFTASDEQWFVRVVATVPFEELASDESYRLVVSALSPILE
jgi:hypothetical protein